ncbi:MAG: hypothetical protein WBG08_14615 [Litorimonas sp.]
MAAASDIISAFRRAVPHGLSGWRTLVAVFLFGSALPLNALAGDPADALPLRHADLIEALRALDSSDAQRAHRAHAALRISGATGLTPDADPVSEIVSLYAVELADAPALRGHMRGPMMRSGVLEGEDQTFRLVFEGGEGADVTLYTDRDIALSVSTGDEAVCETRSRNGVAHCQWLPFLSKSHVIRVSRLDSDPLRYTMIVN